MLVITQEMVNAGSTVDNQTWVKVEGFDVFIEKYWWGEYEIISTSLQGDHVDIDVRLDF